MTTADGGRLFHPATLLAVWLTLLVLLSTSLQGWLGLTREAGLLTAMLTIGFACVNAASRFLTLLRRARWLLLSLAVIGIWTTPGLAIDWLPGATYEGVSVTSSQLMQLLMTFAMVALLLRHLSIDKLLLGLHTLTVPLKSLGFAPNHTTLRLALTLAEVDTGSVHPGFGRERFLPATQSVFVLPVLRFSSADFLLIALAGSLACAGGAYA